MLRIRRNFRLHLSSLQVLLGSRLRSRLQCFKVLHGFFGFGAQEEEDDVLDALASNFLGDEGVAAGLLAVSAVGDVLG